MAEGKTCTDKTFSQNERDFVKISTLFFDLDNTLISTRSVDSKTCRKLVDVLENRFGFTKDEATAATSTFLKSFRRCPDNSQTSLDSWRTYLWREALSSRHKHLAEQIYQKWLTLRFHYLSLPAEFIHMLRSFRAAGYLLGLITNGPSNAQWEKVQKLNIRQYFDCVLVSSDLPWEKPNPNIFYAACNFLNVKPSECAMIGDKLTTDIKGGRLANLGATFWLPLNPTETDLSGVDYPPDLILRNLLDLSKLFPALYSAPLLSSSSSLNTLTTKEATNIQNNLQTRRRFSHISYSGTTRTCESRNHHHSKNRRGGSLPDIEYMNSETENSSDSIFS